jgi:molecular chaperone HtpG
MYIEPMSMYREYIQNSADAVDLARSAGTLHSQGRVEIRIDPSARTVFIRDNGCGLGKDAFVHQLTALGGSKKRGTGSRGFRGVGRLAGLAFCQELIFRSRQEGEAMVHELSWDARELRSLLRSADSSQDIRDVTAKTVHTREASGRSFPDRFFEVELRGVVRHGDDRLLNEEQVSNYLAEVAPVAFSPDFQFRDQIKVFLEGHGIRLGAIEIEIIGRGLVYRPHRNSIVMGKSAETHFQELTTMLTPGRDGGIAAVTWVLHHDYRGGLPTNSLVDGWRLRSGDIQVGGNDLLQALFPESRFNAWCVAETHVLDPRILANGRRDHFEQNAYYFDLSNHLAPHARDIALRCRTSSITRNLVRSIEEHLTECRQNLRVIERGIIANATASKLAANLSGALDQVQRLSSRTGISTSQRLRYQGQIKRLRRRMLRLDAVQCGETAFANFTPTQRTILTEVFNAIYQSTDDLQRAQRLVDKIVIRLNRKRTRLNKKTTKSGRY